MKHLYPYLRRFRKESILAPLFKMLEATFDLLVPMVVADIIKVGIAGGDTTYIWTRCGLLVLMALIGLLCSFTAQYFAARAAIGTSTGLRHELMAHIQSLSFSELDTLGVSTLITRMTSDVNQVQNGLNMFLRLFLRSPFIVAGAMIAAFTIDTQIALIFLAAIPVLAVIVFGIMRITSPMYKTVQVPAGRGRRAQRARTSPASASCATFGREDAEEENFVQQNGSLNAMQLKVGRIAALMNPLTYVVVNLGIIGILYFGANKIGRWRAALRRRGGAGELHAPDSGGTGEAGEPSSCRSPARLPAWAACRRCWIRPRRWHSRRSPFRRTPAAFRCGGARWTVRPCAIRARARKACPM